MRLEPPARRDLAAIVLAAGRSTRMGVFKPLLPFGPHTVIEQVLATLRAAGIAGVHVVLGWQADRLIPVVERAGAAWLRNEQFDEGMYASIQAAARCLSAEVAAFFLLPGDMPLVRPETLRALANAWDAQPAAVLYPCHCGRRGHPPLIAAALIPEILRDCPPRGLREVLARHAGAARDIECGDPGILHDLDTPEEYQQALRAAEGEPNT